MNELLVQNNEISRRQTQALEMILEPLRKAMLQCDLNEETVIQEMNTMFKSNQTSDTTKLKIIDIISKWGQWYAPKEHNINIKKIVIQGKPEDFNP
jgi:ATP-dependent RNA circularization protein (DNA/RNA ligase family)